MAGLRNSLQLRIAQTQTLTMTPQLQQAIRLLQLSTLDLRQEIQQTVESNPLLEIDESLANANFESLDALAEQEQRASGSEDFDPFSDDSSFYGTDIQMSGLDNNNEMMSSQEVFSDNAIVGTSSNQVSYDDANTSSFNDDYSYENHDLGAEQFTATNEGEVPKIAESSIDPGVSSTEENYDSIIHSESFGAKTSPKGNSVDDDSVFEGETQENLKDHLTWQLDCSPLKGRDRAIAQVIIDGIDDSGYLTESLEDVLSVVTEAYPDTTIEDVNIVLKLVQHYDPLGVASRNVQECLTIQLQELVKTDKRPEVQKALEVITNYIDLLSNHDYRGLCNRLGVKEDELKKINEVIVSLTPRPGHTAVKSNTDFIVPDVLVVKDKDGKYDVILNPDALPRVKLNEQ